MLVSFGHHRTIALRNSQQLHRIKTVNISMCMGEDSGDFHPWLRSDWQLMATRRESLFFKGVAFGSLLMLH